VIPSPPISAEKARSWASYERLDEQSAVRRL
jgi:hypothetical protein